MEYKSKSLLNADIEKRSKDYKSFHSTTFNLIIPLIMPAVLGSVFPLVTVAWLVIGVIFSYLLGNPNWLFLVLAILYLACSAIVWIGMVIVSRKYKPRAVWRP